MQEEERRAAIRVRHQTRHIEAMRPLKLCAAAGLLVRALTVFDHDGEQVAVNLVTANGTLSLLLGENRTVELVVGVARLREHQNIVLSGEVNWLIDELGCERLPAINLAHVDLS